MMKKAYVATKARLAMAGSLRWLLLLFVTVGPVWGAEGRPDFSGEWKLSLAKSSFGVLPAPDSRTDLVEHHGPKLRIVRRQTRSLGEVAVELSCVLDGSECSVKITGAPLRLKTKAKWEGDKLVFESEGILGEQEGTVHEEWSLAPDRKSITIQRALSSLQGSTHQTIVLERQ